MTPRSTALAQAGGRLLMLALIAVLATWLLQLNPWQGFWLFMAVVPLVMVGYLLEARDVRNVWIRLAALSVAAAVCIIPVSVAVGFGVMFGAVATLAVIAAFAFNDLFDRLGRRPRPGDLPPR